MENTYKNENVALGILGAFLFSLVGGVVWFVLYLLGYIAGISGLLGAICAIKGYSIFAKKESVKGIVISIVIALLVIVLAWYLCLAYDVWVAHNEWYEQGEIDYTITYLDAVLGSGVYLEDPEIAPGYFGDLGFGLLFCVLGGGSYVAKKIKAIKEGA